MGKIYPESHVEVSGVLARYYEHFLNLGTLGRYGRFVRRAVEDMGIGPEDQILDLGAGTGYNASFMKKFLGDEGAILGLDISENAIFRFRKRFADSENVKVEKRRIDEPLPFESRFDKVFTSFVLHGLPHPARKRVLENVHEVLKPGGKFFVLDYGDFEVSELPFYLKIPFRIAECKYAYDYLNRDWETLLMDFGLELVS
ncbi:MAG: class I SAM-dependent methyltransferase, partial [Candidatus Bipolaricaulota bacterium]